MNEARAAELIGEIVGTRPLSVVRQTFGHCSHTYEVVLPERSLMLRLNENPAVFATTQRNIAVLAKLGLPVPSLLVSDRSKARHPFAYMLLERIPGRDLRDELAGMTPGQMTRLAEQIVDYQRRVMTLPQGSGFGFVGIDENGPYRTWWELLSTGHRQRAAHPLEARVMELEAGLARQFSRFEPYLRRVPPICFLDDLTVKNVIVLNGELQGLVDFDCVCYGDPLYWIALTATGVLSDVGQAGLFYVEELKRLWDLAPGQREALALYSAQLSLDFVQRFAARETWAWNARMLSAIDTWLGETEAFRP